MRRIKAISCKTSPVVGSIFLLLAYETDEHFLTDASEMQNKSRVFLPNKREFCALLVPLSLMTQAFNVCSMISCKVLELNESPVPKLVHFLSSYQILVVELDFENSISACSEPLESYFFKAVVELDSATRGEFLKATE